MKKVLIATKLNGTYDRELAKDLKQAFTIMGFETLVIANVLKGTREKYIKSFKPDIIFFHNLYPQKITPSTKLFCYFEDIHENKFFLKKFKKYSINKNIQFLFMADPKFFNLDLIIEKKAIFFPFVGQDIISNSIRFLERETQKTPKSTIITGFMPSLFKRSEKDNEPKSKKNLPKLLEALRNSLFLKCMNFINDNYSPLAGNLNHQLMIDSLLSAYPQAYIYKKHLISWCTHYPRQLDREKILNLLLKHANEGYQATAMGVGWENHDTGKIGVHPHLTGDSYLEVLSRHQNVIYNNTHGIYAHKKVLEAGLLGLRVLTFRSERDHWVGGRHNFLKTANVTNIVNPNFGFDFSNISPLSLLEKSNLRQDVIKHHSALARVRTLLSLL